MLRHLMAFFLLFFTGTAWADPSLAEINEACGVPLFSDESLWDDEAADVAARLGWPEESRTSSDASYRLYSGAEMRFFGCRPYSLSMHAEESKPSTLSIVFANKGDAVDIAPNSKRKQANASGDYKRAIQDDKKDLTALLTSFFGEPVADSFGQGRETRESVKR